MSTPLHKAMLAGLLLALTPGSGHALERLAPYSILPDGRQQVQMNMSHTSYASDMFSATGKHLARVENTSTYLRLVYRNTLLAKTELTLDLPWYLERGQRTHATSGKTTSKYDSDGGLGDVSVALTRQLLTGKNDGWAVNAGVEVKPPTGDEEDGLGTGAWGGLVRAAVCWNTGFGQTYLVSYYNVNGKGDVGGVRTDEGDELYAALGWRSPLAGGFGVDVRAIGQFVTSTTVKENNGQAVEYETYALPGFQVTARFLVRRNVEVDLMHRSQFPERHGYRIGNASFVRESGARQNTSLMLRWAWQ
ncbi:MAG: transporter [Thermodesulfobacteriota bacterium]